VSSAVGKREGELLCLLTFYKEVSGRSVILVVMKTACEILNKQFRFYFFGLDCDLFKTVVLVIFQECICPENCGFVYVTANCWNSKESK